MGSAGPLGVFRDFSNAPLANTWYTAAQANSLAGFDLDPSDDDINMTFNNLIGSSGCLTSLNWWLGINSAAPSGTISFYDTILHELAHGLGFLSLVDPNGQRFLGRNDTFMLNLFDLSFNNSWSNLSNFQRATSAINTGNLVWSGTQVTQNSDFLASGINSNRVRLFAPSPFQQGSSVSHWDIALSPDELMEPSATPTSDDCATTSAFADMGWETIGDDAGRIGLTRSTNTAFESEGNVSISIERSFDCGRVPQIATSVSVQSSNGSAFSGLDYLPVNQTVSWAAGETGIRTVNISILDDGVEDGGEMFTVSLSNPTSNATLGAIATTTITIQDELSDEFCVPIRAANGNVAVI